jgi:DNA-binding NarL/FixJ family response regulator
MDISGSLAQRTYMKVLIVDRSILICERLGEIIADAGNIIMIHKAVSYEEARKLFDENRHETVLLDLDLSGNGAVKLLKEIKRSHARTCVVVLFTRMDECLHEQCKSLNVSFFFDKYYDFEKISELFTTYH